MAAHILSLKYCTCISVYKVLKMFTASELSVFMTLGPCIQYISGIWLICMHSLVSCQPVGGGIQKQIGALHRSLHARIGQPVGAGIHKQIGALYISLHAHIGQPVGVGIQKQIGALHVSLHAHIGH